MVKKAQLQLSISTIVVLVIAIVMLILGIIFVRSIMCSGIQMTQQIDQGVKKEIQSIFGADEFGVKCVGEGVGEPYKMGSGGRRLITCVIKTEDAVDYKLTTNVTSIKGASQNTVNSWILDRNWKGPAIPGGEGTIAEIVLLDIPRDAPTTTLKISTESIRCINNHCDPITRSRHTSFIEIVPAGFFRTTIC